MCFRYPFDVFKCGKCPECLQDLRREWSLRLQLHTDYSGVKPFYCHLTYDNKHVPINEFGKLTLSKYDVQLFIKRLRHYVKEGFKYYIAGEYGPNSTHRPHYHCVLFGFEETLSEDEVKAILRKTWQNGDVRKKSCWLKSYAQLHYATKYIINYFDEDFQHKTAPFRLVSSGFGIPFVNYAREHNLFDINVQRLFKCNYGTRVLNGQKVPTRWYYEKPYWVEDGQYVINPLLLNFRDFIEICQIVNGKMTTRRFPMPRYFAEKLYTDDFRTALSEVKRLKIMLKNNVYHSEYMLYDSDTVPMWLQLKRYKWDKKKKNKKDKLLRDSINILND